jgi:hypothetical protein
VTLSDHKEFDTRVRRHVYEQTVRAGRPPSVGETARALGVSEEVARDSFRRLAEGFVLVLQEGSGEILMAAPFSAVPTPFVVRTSSQEYFANCAWDALGIPAMLGEDAETRASCGCCGAAMSLKVEGGRLARDEGVIHFALPAARWWDNIAFT